MLRPFGDRLRSRGTICNCQFTGTDVGAVANRLVAGLILQIAGDGDRPLLRKDRAEGISSARRRYREILADPKLSLEDRDMFLDGFQVE